MTAASDLGQGDWEIEREDDGRRPRVPFERLEADVCALLDKRLAEAEVAAAEAAAEAEGGGATCGERMVGFSFLRGGTRFGIVAAPGVGCWRVEGSAPPSGSDLDFDTGVLVEVSPPTYHAGGRARAPYLSLY